MSLWPKTPDLGPLPPAPPDIVPMHDTGVPGMSHLVHGFCVCPCLLCCSKTTDADGGITSHCICLDCKGTSCKEMKTK